MKRGSKNIIAFALVLVFALGVLCFSLAAPSLSLASVTGCSQGSGPMKMTGCEYPSYLCGFDSSNLLSQGAVSSARPNDLPKNTLALAVGEAFIDSSNDAVLLIGKERENALAVGLHKVSIRLFNSVLNL
jgi:hypothetical protein